jgi:hypothetical protein
MTQDDLFGPPPSARNTDPDTSHRAAESVDRARLRETQRIILNLLVEHGPATDEDIADWLFARGHRVSPSGARTRRAELVAKGLVYDTGRRLRTRSNRPTIVWAAAPLGGQSV